jgi:UDP-N-acetylmuramate--alanine ligase
VGIGGAGMSGLAEILKEMGYVVTGSDLKESETISHLRTKGIDVKIGHKEENVRGADLVVFSSAIGSDNPEILWARRELVPIIHRGEMTAMLMRRKRGIAVFGAHGKTTTTSLIAFLLEKVGYDPTVLIGGRLRMFHAHGKLGKGEFFVAETDESDGSFMHFYPEIAVFLNLDEEHMDYWGSLTHLKEKVVKFAHQVPFYGSIFLNADDPHLWEIRPRIQRMVHTFSISGKGDITGSVDRYEKKGMWIKVRILDEEVPPFFVPLMGEHMLQDILPAMGVVRMLGGDLLFLSEVLREFPGVDRRFEVLLEREDLTIVHDYGHHPTEIKVTLQAVTRRFGDSVGVVWQPHRYSRTRILWDAFQDLFLGTKNLIVTEVYPAGEREDPEVDMVRFVEELREKGHRSVRYIPSSELVPYLLTLPRRGMVWVLFGAGSIGQLAKEYATLAEKT